MNREELEAQLNQYDEAYFNQSKPLISDEEYNALVDKYNLLYGEYQPKAITHMETKLPVYSPSLAKIKLRSKFDLHKEQHPGPYIVMDKLDGCSIIIHYMVEGTKIYTHSTDGYFGSDISHLYPYLNIPKDINEELIVRGELVIDRQLFKKYKGEYANERNISSVINDHKNYKPELIADFTYVAFNIQSSNQNLKDKLVRLKEYGFYVVKYEIQNDIDFDDLTDDMKNGYCEFLRDGKVISTLEIEEVTEGLPKSIVAFKTIGEVMEAKVVGVEWNISMHMKLKPRVNIETIFLEGGNVSWSNGLHANFIYANNIGPGTTLLMSRDIVPKIYEVIKSTKADMPKDEYTWDATHTNIIGVMTDKVLIKRIYYFFDLLKIKFLGLKTIEKLFNNGLNTLQLILSTTVEELINIPGIQQSGAQRIVESIRMGLPKVTLVKMMACSCLFPNFAEKKLQQIVNKIPTVTKIMLGLKDNNLTLLDLQNVSGIKETADIFLDNIDNFKNFLDETNIVKKILIEKEEESLNIEMIDCTTNEDEDIFTPPLIIKTYKGTPLAGMVIVFSGDKKSTEQAIALGAVVDKGLNKHTTLLVVDKVGTMNTKEKICTQKKIPIMSLADFKAKYLTNATH